MTAVMLHHWSAQKELFLFLIQGKLIALKCEGQQLTLNSFSRGI